MNYVLPNGWQWVRLGEIAHVIRGVTFDRNDATDSASEDTYPILRAGNISGDLITDRDLVWVPSGRVSSEQLMQVGDVAICMSSGSADVVGKTAQLRSSWTGSVGAFCALIRAASPVVDTDYFGHVFTSPVFTFWRKRQSMGANIQNLRLSDVESVMIPVPPLSEQRRIVEILNEARDIRRLRQQADDLTTQLIPAIFNEMFGHLNASMYLPLARLWAKPPQNGLYKHADSYGAGTQIVRIGDFYDGTISDITLLQRLRLTEKESHLYSLLPDDILVNRVNSIEYLGKSAIVPRLDEIVVFESNMMRFSVAPSRVLPQFLIAYLQHPVALHELRRRAKHAVNQASINQSDLGALRIPVPPIDEQTRFVNLFTAVKDVVARDHSTTSTLSLLTSSLLAHAFSGELTADWRTQNREQLAQEAADRDQWLRENGVKLTTPDHRGQGTTDSADGLAWELNRDQQSLLEQIRKLDRNDNGGLFTLSTLKLKAPLDKLPPDTVRRHLDVLAARGLVLAVSRRAERGESVTFGNVYRVPLGDDEIVGTAQQPDHARLSELGRLSRLGRVFFESISDRISLTDSLDGAIVASEGDE